MYCYQNIQHCQTDAYLIVLLCIRTLPKSYRAYQCATQDDLWQTLTEEAHRIGTLQRNITVKQIMDTWILQTGFPLVTVKRNYNANSITVSQVAYVIIRNRIRTEF